MHYGWVVLGMVTLFEGLSGFGRTAAMSPFLKDLCHDLFLSTAQISGAYTLANLCAGCLLPKVGRWYDRIPAQLFLGIFTFIFGLGFIVLSQLQWIPGSTWTYFSIFLLCFVGIRTAVNAYMLAGRAMIASWFTFNRGFATALSCFLLATIASSMPWLNYRLHLYFSWKQVWFMVGLSWILVMPMCCMLVKKPKLSLPSTPKRGKTSDKAIQKNPIFILILVALFFKAFQNTSLAFHLIPICEELGANTEFVTLCLMTTPIMTCVTTFIVGHYFEKIGSKIVLLSFLFLDMVLLGLFKCIVYSWAIYGFAFIAGTYWGLRQIIAYMVIPNLFGIRSIGEMNGWASSCLCMGSSMGPFMFSLVKSFSSYQMALTLCFGFSCLLFVLAYLMRHKMIAREKWVHKP